MAAKLVYLDNASTSYPKPKAVARAVERAISRYGVNPGRGGYALTRRVDRLVYEARKSLASFFNLADASRLIFTPGGTQSLNMAIRGLLKKGDHVICTGRQHNAVIRPIHASSLAVSALGWDGYSAIRESDVKALCNRRSRAIVVNHASNVDGLLFPLERIGRIARKLGLALIVDAAQTAGLVEIDVVKSKVDLLCVTGHKSLMGPAGIGLLAVSPTVDIEPLVFGGTGSFSEAAVMPRKFPDYLESGSINLPGIAGLAAGLKEVQRIGIRKVFARKMGLCVTAYDALRKIGGVTIYWPRDKKARVPLFSFTIDGIDPSEVGDALDRRYSIACRVGLHCAPGAHREIGSYPLGSIRFSPGVYTSKSDINRFITAVSEISGKRTR